jgi:hypothetical protein
MWDLRVTRSNRIADAGSSCYTTLETQTFIQASTTSENDQYVAGAGRYRAGEFNLRDGDWCPAA